MNINEAEKLTGITKKTIRYYEEAGLLSVERDKRTGYRIFQEETVNILKKIKLYRSIGLSIREIKAILKGTVLPSQALLRQIKELEGRIYSLQRKKDLLLSVMQDGRITQTDSELIYDLENIIYCKPSYVREKLIRLDRQTVILAALGASPQVNEFLQALYPELDIETEQKKLGRVKIEDIDEAQVKLIIHMNSSR